MLNVTILSVTMLNVIMLSAIMLSVILGVIMLSIIFSPHGNVNFRSKKQTNIFWSHPVKLTRKYKTSSKWIGGEKNTLAYLYRASMMKTDCLG